MLITPTEARVLGSLIEKEISTPEYYPLSLNALVNASNQKNNREPVMHLEELEVHDALRALERRQLAGPARGADGRVTKYEHRLQEVFNFTRGETAILCELLLRGPQTPGELRNRTERLYRFEELQERPLRTRAPDGARGPAGGRASTSTRRTRSPLHAAALSRAGIAGGAAVRADSDRYR